VDLKEIDRLYRSMLGPFPERVPTNVEFLEEEECDGFTRSLIAWDNDATERVRGYLLRPTSGSAKLPAMMAFHGHGAWESDKKSTAGVDVQEGRVALGPAPQSTAIKHCFMNHLPNVLKYGLETYDLFRLIAPRPFLMINGSTEPQDPVVATQELFDKAKSAWEEVGAGDEFRPLFHEAGHGLTPATRVTACDWLVEKLGENDAKT
jgi:hypothetical protein